MAFALPQSFNDDILSAFPEDEGSTVSATITASGGTTPIKSSLGVSADHQGAETTVSATAEAETEEGGTTTATASTDADSQLTQGTICISTS